MATWKNKDEEDDIICLDDSPDVPTNKTRISIQKQTNKIDDDIEIIDVIQASDVYIIENNKPPKNPRRSFNSNRKSVSNQLLISASFLQSKEPVKFNKNLDKELFIISEDEAHRSLVSKTKEKTPDKRPFVELSDTRQEDRLSSSHDKSSSFNLFLELDSSNNLDSDIQSLRINSPESASKEKVAQTVKYRRTSLNHLSVNKHQIEEAKSNAKSTSSSQPIFMNNKSPSPQNKSPKNQTEMTSSKLEKHKSVVKSKRTSLNHLAVIPRQTEAEKSNVQSISSSQPTCKSIKNTLLENKSPKDLKNRHKTSAHIKAASQKNNSSVEVNQIKRHSIAIQPQVQIDKNTNYNPFNEITFSVTNCKSSNSNSSSYQQKNLVLAKNAINESQKLASTMPLKKSTRKSLQASNENQKSNINPSTQTISNLVNPPADMTNKLLNDVSSLNRPKKTLSTEKLTRKSLQPNQLSSTTGNNIKLAETSNTISQISLNNLSKPKEIFSIFRKEIKSKNFPLTMKSVSDCLYEFCLPFNLDNISLEENQSLVLNLDSKNLDMMEAHYMNDQLFYLRESFKIMEITLYKKVNTKFNLFDLYVQFEKTFNYYIKNGLKNNSVEDFNYHFSSFNEYLRYTDIIIEMTYGSSKLEDAMDDEDDSPLDRANAHWKMIISLNEKVLKNLLKEVNNPDLAELNYCFFDIAKQLLEIFIRKIYETKFSTKQNNLENYFNIGEEFFNSFLDIFQNFVLKNLQHNITKNFMSQRFIQACHNIQHLIYYSLIFYRRFDKSKTKLFQMISSFQNIYMKLSDANKEFPLLFIMFVLNHNEIKIKLCEKLLIDCRFALHPFKEECEIMGYSKFQNLNDNNEIIFKYFKNLLNEKENEQTIEFLDLLNIYIECFVKTIDSGTKSNDSLIATLFEIHDNTEDFSKSGKNLIFNLRILIKKPIENATCFRKIIKQLFFLNIV